MVGLQDSLNSIADTLMNLVALTLVTFEHKRHLFGGLLRCHCGMNRQQTKTWQTRDTAFDAIRIFNRLTQHLISATDANHHFSIAMRTLDGLCTTITTQFHQIIKRGFGARQNDDVCLLDIRGVVGIEEIDTRVTL